MNSKKARTVRHMIRKQKKAIISDFVERLKNMQFRNRLHVALKILFVKRDKRK